MKKYVKPELFYERYELSQHIADCQWELTHANKESCVAEPDQDPFFLPMDWGTLFTEQPRCDNVNWQDYCYQTGSSGNVTVFMS